MVVFDYIPVRFSSSFRSFHSIIPFITGVKIGENKFSSPVVSLHTFKINNRRSNQDVAGLTVADPGDNGTKLPTYHVDSITTTNFRKEDRDEKVRCIPVEDILSISFSTDVKKEYKTIETIKERVRPPKPPLGCCGRMKKSIKETCCCCPSFPCEICQPEEPEKPEYDRSDRTEVKASRLILVEMKYIRHSNIHIPSHVQVLPDDKRIQFYKENFFTDTIYFFLINQTDANPDENRFDVQRQEAERLIRVVVQLRNMVNRSFFLSSVIDFFLG